MTKPVQRHEHFKEAMAEILARVVDFPRNIFVTVVDARITDDQANAKIVLSLMPITAKETALQVLSDNKHEILDAMAKSMRLRKLPRLYWAFDESNEKIWEIEGLIEDLKEKGEI
ncbi:MAG: ribosome-binding factor A [Patescibacteria group bacterium]|jgi:ribosome-binding factor A